MMNILELLKNEKVEWKKLGEVADIQRGRVISKKYLEEHMGEFPVYSSQTQNDGVIGRIDTYDFNGEYITWTTDGAYAGTVFYRLGKFSITNICGLIKPKDKLLIKYLFYWLQIEAKKHVASGSGNPKLMSNVVAKIKIPIPSLEIQGKIVNILDKLTNYIFELQSELQSRTKQYTYYRDKLLSEEYLNKITQNKTNNFSLKSVAEYSSKRISAEELDISNYVGVDNLLKDKYGREDSSYVPETGTSTRFEKGNILIGNIRPYLRKIWYADRIGGTNGDVLAVSVKNEDFIDSRYLYHVLADERFFQYNIKYSKGAKMPRGDKNKIMEYHFPIPPLHVQQHVVSVLDKFDILVNDIKEGLPKEIEQRQKQYEYWRSVLLTFK
jgi:putative type I restriction enzyme specificity protein